jgi:hypothetical protein
LVESIRTAQGPRHQHICHLGSLDERFRDEHWQRLFFWATAHHNMDKSGVTGETRERIVATLESVIPRPDEASRVAAERDLASREERLRSLGLTSNGAHGAHGEQ